MTVEKSLAVLLLATYALFTTLPCSTPIGAEVTDIPGASHAHGAGEHVVHAPVESTRLLTAPCPCGCGDGPASSARATARTGFALLRCPPSVAAPSLSLPLDGVQVTLSPRLISAVDPIPI